MFGRKKRTSIRRGDEVIAVEQIRDIPAGTHGIVRTVAGQAWTRYWVAWSTGEWMGTIDNKSVVRADLYDEYVKDQAERAARAAVEAASPKAVTAGEAAVAGGDGRVPEHLLERSRQARARLTAAASA